MIPYTSFGGIEKIREKKKGYFESDGDTNGSWDTGNGSKKPD